MIAGVVCWKRVTNPGGASRSSRSTRCDLRVHLRLGDRAAILVVRRARPPDRRTSCTRAATRARAASSSLALESRICELNRQSSRGAAGRHPGRTVRAPARASPRARPRRTTACRPRRVPTARSGAPRRRDRRTARTRRSGTRSRPSRTPASRAAARRDRGSSRPTRARLRDHATAPDSPPDRRARRDGRSARPSITPSRTSANSSACVSSNTSGSSWRTPARSPMSKNRR